jgi:hypothetical protein
MLLLLLLWRRLRRLLLSWAAAGWGLWTLSPLLLLLLKLLLVGSRWVLRAAAARQCHASCRHTRSRHSCCHPGM